MTRLALLEAQRVSAKLAFEAAFKVNDAHAEMIAMLELERVDNEIKRELDSIEREDE